MKNLENFGVQELDAKELKEVDGGGWIADFVHAIKCAYDPANFGPRPGQIYYY